MSSAEWAIAFAGIAVIAWINWYFFFSHAPAVATVGTSAGPAEVRIVVDGGYEPATVRVKAGQSVRLVFERRDRSSCSEEVVFPDFAIRKFLPTGEDTSVQVTPPKAGTYEFMCGMSMLRGRLVAE
ncbi:MAG: cupredoxin domain-containing protein [Gemmatimonadaceae bacterium]|nr:cupredoxin domain-containing protein [Gemmatimonadaceae bacterium]